MEMDGFHGRCLSFQVKLLEMPLGQESWVHQDEGRSTTRVNRDKMDVDGWSNPQTKDQAKWGA
jgi:hypothetical protein